MKFAFGINIGCVRRFGGFKQPNPDRFVVDFDLGQPLIVFLSDTRKSAFIFSRFLVLRVFGVCDFAEIAQRIIRAVSVNVVQLFNRPAPVHMKPCESVGQIQSVINTNDNVTVPHDAPSDAAFSTSTAANCPCKNSRAWVIVKQFTNTFRRQTMFHICPPTNTVNINCVVLKGQA